MKRDRIKRGETERLASQAGRPPEMEDGRRVNVYLDAASIETARRIGDGNVSEGIRTALKQKGE